MCLKIKDLGSTYGTYLNPTSSDNGKIGTDKWTEMPNGSTFHFGIQNEWLLKWEDIRILCSAVGPTGRSRLNVALSKIGAKQVPDWESNITHLVMEKVVFTQKVVFQTFLYVCTTHIFMDVILNLGDARTD